MKSLKKLFILLSLFVLVIGCQEDEAIAEPETNSLNKENSKIHYGLSLDEFINSSIAKSTASEFKKEFSDITAFGIDELSTEELAERLDLDQSIITTEDGVEVLLAPIRNFGDAERYLYTIANVVDTADSFTFIKTYTDGADRKSFFITYPNHDLVYPVQLNDQYVDVSALTADFPCSITIYQSCSSGAHSASQGNADECDFWTQPGGTPPQEFTIPDPTCSNGYGGGSSGGGTPGNDGDDDIDGLPENGGPGVGTLPLGDSGDEPTITQEDCIPGFDCDVSDYEICQNQGNPSWECCGLYNQESCSDDEMDTYLKWEEDQWEFDNIDTNGLDSCSSAIVEDLKNTDTTDIGNALRNFDDELHDINLEFLLVDSLSNGAAGRTGNYNQYEFWIKLSQEKLEVCTDIYAAHTIMHEIIHAYMFSLISRKDPNYFGTTLGELPNIPDTFYGFVDAIVSDTTSMVGPDQHDYIANHFVTVMADALYTFDNESQEYEYYWSLSWSGLYESEAWKRHDASQNGSPATNDSDNGLFKFALTEERMIKIQEIDLAEQENTIDSKGTKFNLNGDCFD